MSSLTPLELRQFRREGQRSLRLVFNELAAGIDSWKKIVSRGKYIATELTNLALESSCLQDVVERLGEDAPDGTLALLTRRCRSKISAQEAALRDLVSELKHVCGDLEQACDLFESLLGKEPPLNDPRADVALCTCLTYRQTCKIVAEIVNMYKKEVKIKIKVVDDFSQACSKIFSDTPVERGYWHVHITAWMMDIYASREIIDEYMSQIAVDAGMPYSSPSKTA